MRDPLRDEPPPGGSIEQQAADWLSRRERGLAPEEQEALSDWLLADPRHAAAARRMEASWQYLQRPRLGGQGDDLLREVEARVARRVRRRRQVYGWSFTVLAAAAVLVFAFVPFRTREPAAPSAPGWVQPKPDRQKLPDGSVVELNATGEIDREFTDTLRTVRLIAGTALFTVKKDPARPFVVMAGEVAVQAVGTEFCVQLDPKHADVLVTEGRVKVARTKTPAGAKEPPAALVSAEQHVIVPRDAPAATLQVQSVPPQAMSAALSWRNQRVEFTDAPLKEVVPLFNQRNKQQLDLEEKAADVRVSGIAWLDDPESFSRLVAASAGLVAVPQSNGSIMLRKP